MKRKWMNTAKNLPTLKHGHPQSDVVEWIRSQDDLQFGLFDILRENGYIKFNPQTKTWSGVGYEQD